VPVAKKPLKKRPIPPEPEAIAPPEILEELEDIVERPSVSGPELMRAQQLTERLLEIAPNDARSQHFAGVGRTLLEGREYDARRDLTRSAFGTPRLDDRKVSRAIYFLRQLGYERAALSLAGDAWGSIDRSPPRAASTLAYLYQTAAPPIQDFVHAEVQATRAIERDARDPGSMYMTVQAHLTRAQARLAQGNVKLAGKGFEETGRVAADGPLAGVGRICVERAELCARGEVRAEDGVRSFFVNFSPTAFMDAVEKCNEQWRTWQPDADAKGARAFIALSRQQAQTGHSENAAIAALRAAWLLDRIRDHPAALAAYEGALELVANAPIDARALIARATSYHLIERGLTPERAERLAREAAVEIAFDDPMDVRTFDELAEAWVLVARARLLMKKRDLAREALAEAESYAPHDKRGVEQVRALLEKP
jgi:hypothetical protein